MSGPNGPQKTRRTATIAHAHSADEAYVYLALNGSALVGSVHLPLSDLQAVVEEIRDVEVIDHAVVEGGRLRAVHAYVADHFSIAGPSGEVPIDFGDGVVRVLSSGPYLFMDYEVPRFEVPRPSRLEVKFTLFDSLPAREALLIALISRGWAGLYRHAETSCLLYTSPSPRDS